MSDDQQRHTTVDSEGVDSDTLDDILAATRRSYSFPTSNGEVHGDIPQIKVGTLFVPPRPLLLTRIVLS